MTLEENIKELERQLALSELAELELQAALCEANARAATAFKMFADISGPQAVAELHSTRQALSQRRALFAAKYPEPEAPNVHDIQRKP